MEEEKKLLKSFSDSFDKKRKERIDEEQLAEAIKKDLEQLYQKIKEFYSGFEESDIKEFVDHYAHVKHRYISSAKYYAEAAEEQLLEFLPKAEECLWQIQQKKLFNLQCQWRAELMELEGIDCTLDFRIWEKDIEHCPCVPPVTQEEVDLYLRYLQSNNYDVRGRQWMYGWQDYEDYKESYQNGVEDRMPQWYSFYDTYMGTTALLSLPDIKKEKEWFYRGLVFEKRREEQIKAGTYKEPTYAEPKPRLNWYDDQLLMEFMSEFETSENMELYLNYEQVRNSSTKEDEQIDRDMHNALFDVLRKAKEHVPIEEHEDWRQAVIAAAEKYKRRKIAEALPLVFEEYCFKLNAGIGFSHKEKKQNEWIEKVKQEILDGRELNGEERNWEY